MRESKSGSHVKLLCPCGPVIKHNTRKNLSSIEDAFKFNHTPRLEPGLRVREFDTGFLGTTDYGDDRMIFVILFRLNFSKR